MKRLLYSLYVTAFITGTVHAQDGTVKGLKKDTEKSIAKDKKIPFSLNGKRAAILV